MKNLFSILIITLLSITAFGQEKVSAFELSGAEFKFDVETYDFGDLFEGSKVSHEFNFTNVGDQELNVYKVQSDCDCIEVEWTKDPINPEGAGTIKVTFDSTEKIGAFYKSIEILSDDKATTKIIRIKGNIKEDFFKDK